MCESVCVGGGVGREEGCLFLSAELHDYRIGQIY